MIKSNEVIYSDGDCIIAALIKIIKFVNPYALSIWLHYKATLNSKELLLVIFRLLLLLLDVYNKS